MLPGRFRGLAMNDVNYRIKNGPDSSAGTTEACRSESHANRQFAGDRRSDAIDGELAGVRDNRDGVFTGTLRAIGRCPT